MARSYLAHLAAFSLLMLAASAALFALTEHFARYCNRDPRSVLNWLTAFLTPLVCLLLWRFDVLVAVTILGALLLLARARPGAAGVVAAVGALIKLIPALVLVLPVLRFRLEPRPALRSLTGFFVTIAVSILAWFAFAGPSLYASFRIHSHRGLEFGSLGAGLLLHNLRPICTPLGSGCGTDSCVCLEVEHAWAPVLSAAALPLQALALSLASVWIALRRDRNDARDAALLLLAYILSGKVLSSSTSSGSRHSLRSYPSSAGPSSPLAFAPPSSTPSASNYS